MATTTPFAYNPSLSPISGTTQVGTFAVGTTQQDYSINPGGVTWWMGPDEDLGYVIAIPVSGNTQQTPVVGGNLTLSPTYKGSDIQLVNSQSALQQFGYQQSVLGQTLINNIDKVMFSVQSNVCTNPGNPFFQSIGIGTTSMNYQGNPYGAYPGNDGQSVGFSMDGNFYYSGSLIQSALPTWSVPNDLIDVAVDLSNGLIWIRVNGGYWNNNLYASPAIGTGGLPIYGLTSFYPVLSPGNNAGQMSILNSPYFLIPEGYQVLGANVNASVGFLGTKNMSNPLSESTFVELTNNSFNQNFTNGNDASTWLTNNGYWNSWVSITPTPTATLAVTPTPTSTIPVTPTPTTTSTPTPSVTNTQTPSTTPTNTLTPTVTPTLTPTPSTTPSPVTGYSFNLVVLPYNYPSSGNTIMVDQAISGTGTTNPNVFATTNNAIYFNAIDTNGIDRTSYFASFTGQSITLTISQTGSTAIYSGDTNAFQSWSGLTGVNPPGTPGKGFSFGYGIAQPGYSAGTTVLIQSATTNWVTGQTVYISASVNGPGVTPTQTATSVTPTPTPTSGASGDFNVSVSQVGSDVIWNGSGSFNLSALSSLGSGTIGAGFQGSQAIWAIGPNTSVDQYSGVTTYSTSFGAAGAGVTSTSGSTFGIVPGGSGRLLLVPSGYVSNTNISGSATYASQTIADMGLIPGTYTWSWGTGGNASSLVMTITS